jgi:hypothetical protein
MLAVAFAGSGFIARPVDHTATRAARAAAAPVANDATLDAHADAIDRARWNDAALQAARVNAVQEKIDAQAAMQTARREAMWDRLAQCETAGNWQNGGNYGGGLGIYIGTWRMYGGTEFAPRPQYATKQQQIVVAERIARDGMGGWGCARRLGLV